MQQSLVTCHQPLLFNTNSTRVTLFLPFSFLALFHFHWERKWSMSQFCMTVLYFIQYEWRHTTPTLFCQYYISSIPPKISRIQLINRKNVINKFTPTTRPSLCTATKNPHVPKNFHSAKFKPKNTCFLTVKVQAMLRQEYNTNQNLYNNLYYGDNLHHGVKIFLF